MFLSKKHSDFIKGFILSGDAPAAYKVAFKSKSRMIARKCAMRLLKRKDIQEVLQKEQADIKKITDEVRNKEIAAAAREGILSDLEIEIILCQIISSKFEYEEIMGYKMITNPNIENREKMPQVPAPIKIKRKPSPTEIKGAADLIFKKRGSFAPQGIDLSGILTQINITRNIIQKK